MRIVNRNFGDEIEQQQNLIFSFDKDLIPDSLLNTWDTIPYVVFTPYVKGKFKWNTTRELVFSPSVGFRPSTDYKAKLSDHLLRYTRMKYKIDPDKIFLSYSLPEITGCKGYWSSSEKKPGMAALKLSLGLITLLIREARQNSWHYILIIKLQLLK